MFIWWVLVFLSIWVRFADRECDFVNRVLATNLDMDPYGPPRKRPRPDSGPLNGSNGANGGHGGVDDCKLSVYFAPFLWSSYVCPVRCLSAYLLAFLLRSVLASVFTIQSSTATFH